MKTLVISLLRLGDFIQTLPAVSGLQRRTRGQVDLLTFAPAHQMAPMVKGIGQWWTLDREPLQQGLGRADIPMLTSFHLLKEKLDQINSQQYDCIVNLTQTYFSAWLAGYLQADARSGLAMDARGQAQFHSPWFQYLDEHAGLEVDDVFHYSDIFFYGSGLQGSERDWSLNETAAGRDEIAQLGLAPGETITLQIMTSDVKKTWPLSAWQTLIAQLSALRPQARFVLLGAPSEHEHLNQLAQQSAQFAVTPAALSLAGALSLLKRSQLLISGDTSIKHLANAAAIPVLELSLGSSDWRRTGIYTPDCLILQPQVTCAPCPHSSPCSQVRHECALSLKSADVAECAHHYLQSDWKALEQRAAVRDLTLYRTRFLANGFWMATDLNPEVNSVAIEKILRRSTWKFLLTREHQKALALYGSESLTLKTEIDRLWPAGRLARHLDFLEDRRIQEHEVAEQKLEQIEAQRPQPDAENVVPITPYRKLSQRLQRARDRAQIELKLIRSLKSQLDIF